MSAIQHFAKKVVSQPGLGQISFLVAVLEPYLASPDAKISRTDSVGRLKTASWTLDFGIAPDEKTIHLSQSTFALLPEKEREKWFAFAEGARFSENFLKMQSSHACIDDGNLRAWGEAKTETESFF